MGKKLDALLRRGFKTNKFKAIVTLAISRLSVLRNQHQARCSVARSDVVQILNLGHHERALLRVEQVVTEQNMLDVYTMVEIYCYMLIQRVSLLEHAKECPEELKEAISSLIYACSRCGEFPELHDIRAIFTSRFGKEFVSRAVQLRNNCGVNPKLIQKLSTRMPSSENRLKVLTEIALENNIVLQIEEHETVQSEVKKEAENIVDEAITNKANGLGDSGPDVGTLDGFDGLSDSVKMRRKYNDVGQAAQAAFESAAYAAIAARAAVELSRANSHDPDPPKTPIRQPSRLAYSPERPSREQMKRNEIENMFEKSISDSSLGSKIEESSDEEGTMPHRKPVMFDDSDSEIEDSSRALFSGDDVTESMQSSEVIISSEKDYSPESEIGDNKLKEGKLHNLSINRAPISVRTRRTYYR